MKKQKLSEQTVLSYLAMRMVVSLPELVRHVGMPASTVLGILSRLGRRGLVAKGENLPGSRGRPMATYKLRLPGLIAVGQFDGTQLVMGILGNDLDLQILEKIEFDHVNRVEEAVDLAESVLAKLEHEGGIKRKDLLGLALSINAMKVGSRTLLSSVLPWAGEASQEVFGTGLGIPVRFVHLPGVLGEYQKFTGWAPKSLVLFRVGDGVSANAIVHGRIFRGHSNQAGELGHIIFDPSGPLCGCGRRGCLEALCSGPAIYKRVVEELESGVASALEAKELKKISPRHAIEKIGTAWTAGDSYVRSVLDQVFDRLGWGLGLVMNLMDPEYVAMGGYVLADRPEWMDEIVRRAQRWILHAALRKTQFAPSRVTQDDELRVIGSSYYYGTSLLKAADAGNEELVKQ